MNRLDQLKLKKQVAHEEGRFDDSASLAAQILLAEESLSTIPTFNNLPEFDSGSADPIFSGFDGGSSGGAGADF